MTRLYADASGLHFAGKDAELERRAAREIRARRRAVEDRLFAENLRMLGESVPSRPGVTREVVHVVGDESEEELWRAWRAYSV